MSQMLQTTEDWCYWCYVSVTCTWVRFSDHSPEETGDQVRGGSREDVVMSDVDAQEPDTRPTNTGTRLIGRQEHRNKKFILLE